MDGSWSSTNNLEYWNKDNVVTTNNNNKIYKTVYSPSPTGFVDPSTAAFTGFTTTGSIVFTNSGFNVSGSFNKGWNFYSQPNSQGYLIFLYALGTRDVYNGRVNNTTAGTVALVGSGGNYWSAGPSGTNIYARSIGFNSGLVNPQSEDGRSSGRNLRPVSE